MKTTNNELRYFGNWFDRRADSFEKSRFGAMAFMITFQSCLGSISAMYALKIDNYALLGVCAVATMGANSIFIAQSTAKWCLGGFYISVFANIFVLIYGIIALYS